MEDSSYKKIVSRLAIVLRRYLLSGIAEAFFTAFAVSGGLMIVFGLGESALYLSPAVKTSLFYFTTGAFIVIFISLCAVRIFRRPGPDGISRMVERAYPHLKERLISAVQLGRLKDAELHGQSGDLVKALLRKVEEETRGLELEKSVPLKRLVLSARCAYGVVVAFLLLTAIFPVYMAGGLYRLADFSRAYSSPGNISIYTLKRDYSIIRGENFSTPGILSGRVFEPLKVMYRWEDSQLWNVKPVDVDKKTGKFTMTIEKPRLSFHYYLESGSYSTPRYSVNVIERPVVEKIEFTLSYPEYTGLGTVLRRDNDGNIRALTGTKVSMKATANKRLEKMTVLWSDSTVTECGVEGVAGTMDFNIEKNIDYHLSIIDTLGISNINPIKYRVTCLIDEKPVVDIMSPPVDVILPLSMVFPVIYRAGDDYGLSSAALIFKLPFEEKPREMILTKGTLGKNFEGSYIWDMSDLGLLPDDAVSYHIAVYDNDTLNGPKMGVSGTGTVRVPSMTDFLSDITETQDRGLNKLRDLSRRTNQDEEPLDEVRRNIISGKELDWSDRNALEEAKEHMEQMTEELKELSDVIKKAAENLSGEDMAAIETLEKYRKISELMDEIVDGDMKEALRRLTQVNIQLDPKKIKQAIEEHKITAEDLKKKLDRLISLLEQVKAIQRFETTKRLIEEIASQQAALALKFREAPENSALWREQKKLASEMDMLEDELKEMTRELSDNFELNTDSFREYLESLDISETMSAAARNMSSGQKSNAEENLDESNVKLSELLSRMDALGAAMKDSNTEEMKRRLFTALVDLLAVSEKQEDLLSAVEKKELSGSNKDELAKRELEIIDAFFRARQSLDFFGELAVEVSGVLEQMMTIVKMSMESSVDFFATGNTAKGVSLGGTALNDLNKSIHILTMFLTSGQGGMKGLPGDLMQQLQSIANGELSLQMQLGGAGSEQMMMQLAAEQQKLAQMLSELGKKIFEDKRLREMLEKLTEDMDDTAEMMRRNEKREFIERRQLDIYRRLLDARRSRRKKDEEKERKSWTAKRNVSLGADELAGDLGEKKRELNERIKKAMEDDFGAEYMRLIRRYFESMLHDYDTR